MNLYSANLELAAVRSITCGSEKIAGWLLPRISNDSFTFEHTAEAYLRIQTLMRRHGDIPGWRSLIEDPAISEDVRKELAHRAVDPVRTRREADELVARLDEYRRARVLFNASREIQSRLKGERVDLDALTDELADAINGTRTIVDLREHTSTIGGKSADVGILREALTHTEQEFIPTGIRAFDQGNQGVPRGSSWIMAGTTGGGKSVLLMQVAMNMARSGASVVIISLEMSRVIVVRRMLAALTGIPLSRINAAHTLDEPTRRLLIRTWHKFHDQVRQNGGRLRIVTPPEDISMEEILATYRPYRYDMLGIDYLGLTKGMDAEDQWRKMGTAVRLCTRVASADNNIVALLCQLSAEGMIRYSKTIMEHAHLAWTWTYVDDAVRESRIITIRQPKSRNLRNFDFMLRENFPIMRLEDIDPNERRRLEEERRGSKRGAGRRGGKTPASISDDRGSGSRRAEFSL